MSLSCYRSINMLHFSSQFKNNYRIKNSFKPHAVGSKELWIQTSEKSVVTIAMEGGYNRFLFSTQEDSQIFLDTWQQLGRLQGILASPDGFLIDLSTSKPIGRLMQVSTAEELSTALSSAAALSTGILLIQSSSDWQIIPAENLVAAFQQNKTNDPSNNNNNNNMPCLMMMTSSAASSRVMLEALESGVDGVVLTTDNDQEVRELMQYLEYRKKSDKERMKYHIARVKAPKAVGIGDRACLDLAESMIPGEGILVGNFARALFLVHSECEESQYINSRPFRVNAGPVHAYVHVPDGKTKYISELKAGDEVEVVNERGQSRTAILGRVKIEKRPLVLVEADTEDGLVHSILLQNAETVKLVGPCDDCKQGWKTVSVSELKEGDFVYVFLQNAARHTGIAIEETISER